MKRPACCSVFLLLLTAAVVAAAEPDPTRVLPPGKPPADSRLGKPKTLNDYFPWIPPANTKTWEARRKELREQILVATGLWPMPPKMPLTPVIHGAIDREDYTVEKVFFASYPGHYVSGNLYRPKGRSGKLAGVLCPHGHWPNGRFYEANEKEVPEQLKVGAEKTTEGARYPLQARCAQLARMGCVVFHYDMVGNADSQQIKHAAGFTDAEAELRLQSAMGLQTFNSICALDFLLSLPEVDPRRIGVTGASGGGTQTFMLCALDDRPAVAFPAVMVSTAMQGGCICENCSYLRQDTGNIEIAALFAPKPLGMTGANDWTINIETRGLPELRALYQVYGAEDRVLARCFPQFQHNYNQVSREVMYNWLNKHLKLGQPEPVVERPFVPVPPRDLSVYDGAHPRPGDAVGAEELRKYLTATSDRQIETLLPKDADGLKEFRQVLGTALRVMIHDRLPRPNEVVAKGVAKDEQDGVTVQKLLLGRAGEGEEVPAVLVSPRDAGGTLVVWVHPDGKGSLVRDGTLTAAARQLLDKKAMILALDTFGTGELRPVKPAEVDKRFAGYTFGYNRPLLANRVHDILTAVGFARGQKGVQQVDLLGLEQAGPWVMLARGLCGNAVARTAADMNRFTFESVRTTEDEMTLPGGLKYGGLPALAALAAPGELLVHNDRGTGADPWIRRVYEAAGAGDRYQREPDKLAAEKTIDWLLR
jgi:dienelactone hydrolase